MSKDTSKIAAYVAAHPGCTDHEVYRAVAQGMPRHFFWKALTKLCAKGAIMKTGIDAVKLFPSESSANTEAKS